MELPIACTLSESQLIERRRTILDAMHELRIAIVELHHGYCFTFQATPDALAKVSQLVDLERQCCSFLTFEIIAEGNSIRLEVTGPPQAKRIIAEFFGV